uniref:Complex 1 LYR protein domain-containing protein n=1 Tax=Aplanochytrium stocchinoi TaxID=215587 RepID=A0A7S3LNU3_9STRA|mmetsp:Transcript_15851/g.18823  ORF Transcript_15851/g.18823 Transcript_15851/m.18823 type:complete len:145 (+) Transcript_15851:131-565(+)
MQTLFNTHKYLQYKIYFIDLLLAYTCTYNINKTIKMALAPQVVNLYKRVCRQIPRICAVYDLDMTEAQVRRQTRKLFDKYNYVTDPKMVSILLEEGNQHLQECVEQWKQKSHLHRLLGHDELPKLRLAEYNGESDFLKDFYEKQ